MNDEMGRPRRFSLSCRRQARLAASEEAAQMLTDLAENYERRALALFNEGWARSRLMPL